MGLELLTPGHLRQHGEYLSSILLGSEFVAPPLISCATLGKLSNFSTLQFPVIRGAAAPIPQGCFKNQQKVSDAQLALHPDIWFAALSLASQQQLAPLEACCSFLILLSYTDVVIQKETPAPSSASLLTTSSLRRFSFSQDGLWTP